MSFGIIASIVTRSFISYCRDLPRNDALIYNASDMVISGLVGRYLTKVNPDSEKNPEILTSILLSRVVGVIGGILVLSALGKRIDPILAIALNATSFVAAIFNGSLQLVRDPETDFVPVFLM